jgi:hypothetical protein
LVGVDVVLEFDRKFGALARHQWNNYFNTIFLLGGVVCADICYYCDRYLQWCGW